MKIEESGLIDIIHKKNASDYPQKPYPSEQAILQTAEDLDAADPKLRAKQRGLSEFMDSSAFKRIEKEGFLRLHNTPDYAKAVGAPFKRNRKGCKR